MKTFILFCVLGKGRIVNITSVKGIIARPTISVYGITKFGAENFSDCLRLEMRKFGVKVSIVEPGNFGGLTGIVKDQNVINLAFKHCWIVNFRRDQNSWIAWVHTPREYQNPVYASIVIIYRKPLILEQYVLCNSSKYSPLILQMQVCEQYISLWI